MKLKDLLEVLYENMEVIIVTDKGTSTKETIKDLLSYKGNYLLCGFIEINLNELEVKKVGIIDNTLLIATK